MSEEKEPIRHLGQGVWENLKDDEKRVLVDPDGELSDEEAKDRMERFEAEHNKQAFEKDERRTQVGAVGFDPTSGHMRGLLDGEELNEQGSIVMVDPAKAELAAERFRNAQPRDVKQQYRRSEALKQLAHIALNRVQDPTGSVVRLKLEQCKELYAEYEQAKAEGYSDSQLDFLPMSAYAHKLWPEDRPAIRPQLAKEFGVFQMASNPSSPLAGKILLVSDVD